MAGIDAVLNREPETGEFEFDLQIGPDGDILTEDWLETAFLVSLFSDRRAEADQVPLAIQRRGWVGDLETPDDPIGSWLWTLDQARITATTAARATDYVERSLRWLVDDGIALAVEADATVQQSGILVAATVARPNAESETLFAALWDATARG